MRCARLAQSLPTVSGPHAVGSLERQHPPWIFRGKSADLIQLPELVVCECEVHRREIVFKLVGAFRTNDDRGYRRLCQDPRERETCSTTSVCFRDRRHDVENIPSPLFVHERKIVLSAARIRGLTNRYRRSREFAALQTSQMPRLGLPSRDDSQLTRCAPHDRDGAMTERSPQAQS